jgi:hypothetical protein
LGGHIRGNTLAGDYCGVSTVRPRGKWLKAEDFTPTDDDMSSAARIYDYKPGWHVFVRKRDAKKWRGAASHSKIVKVLVRGTRDKGYVMSLGTSQLDSFIADEMFIPVED